MGMGFEVKCVLRIELYGEAYYLGGRSWIDYLTAIWEIGIPTPMLRVE